MFNHFILRAKESGVLKRMYRNYHMDLYTNVNFEMLEVQSLGWNNVIFCFIILGFGISLSIIQVMMEFIRKKWCIQKRGRQANMNIRDEGTHKKRNRKIRIKSVDGTEVLPAKEVE